MFVFIAPFSFFGFDYDDDDDNDDDGDDDDNEKGCFPVSRRNPLCWQIAQDINKINQRSNKYIG